jgi:hypothetical protein
MEPRAPRPVCRISGRAYIHIGFKTLFYVVRHLDSIASCLPTGLHLGFFRSWPTLYLPSSFDSIIYWVLGQYSLKATGLYENYVSSKITLTVPNKKHVCVKGVSFYYYCSYETNKQKNSEVKFNQAPPEILAGRRSHSWEVISIGLEIFQVIFTFMVPCIIIHKTE